MDWRGALRPSRVRHVHLGHQDPPFRLGAAVGLDEVGRRRHEQRSTVRPAQGRGEDTQLAGIDLFQDPAAAGHPYVQTHPSPDLGSDLKNPSKTGGTDCSGFVWLALNKAGYKVPANMGWFTGTMASDAKGSHQYLKQISENDAKAVSPRVMRRKKYFINLTQNKKQGKYLTMFLACGAILWK